ncbi:hypothetical protein D3C75_952220 [compost metagenome]
MLEHKRAATAGRDIPANRSVRLKRSRYGSKAPQTADFRCEDHKLVVHRIIGYADRHLTGSEAVRKVIFALQLVICVILRPLLERLDAYL